MTAVKVKMGTNGRLVIPARLRREVGLADGRIVVLEAAEGELRIRPIEDVIDRAQKVIKKYVRGSESLSEELIAERRTEAKQEI